MSESKDKYRWRVIGASVRGAAHERDGLPNQDAIDWLRLRNSAESTQVILAVSDGHGSAKSFRSNIGAEMAVTCAIKEFTNFILDQYKLSNLSTIKRMAEEHLPKQLVRVWKNAVDTHRKKFQFTDKEREQLIEKEGVAALKFAGENYLLAYGATILSVLVTDSFIIYTQLGDGDILNVSETGQVSRPLERDERLFANATTSLCTDNAWEYFRFGFQPIINDAPVLILAATDGYANSFHDENGFRQVGSDFLQILQKEGLKKVKDSLRNWLVEASRIGSGDDITLGLICRMDILPKPVEHLNNKVMQ